MKKLILLSVLVLGLTGCYNYTTHRTINTLNGKTCEYDLTKKGNSIFGYWDNAKSNERRSEQDCAEWLQDK